MNILHTVFSFNSGGIENLLVDVINNWDTANGKIILCVINKDYNTKLLEKIKKRKNVEVILLNRRPGGKSIKFIFKYINIIISRKIKIIHCHSYDAAKIGIISKLIIPSNKIFYTVHATNIYNKFNKRDILIHNIFIKSRIAISEEVRNEIVSLNMKNNVSLIYNGIDFTKFNFKKNFHDSIRIGCVARIVPLTKGQDILIKAIYEVKKHYNNIECWFAGEIQENQKENYKKLIELRDKLNLSNNIIFKGNVDNIPEFLSEIDVLVLPSRSEGFGIAIIEGLASRLPIIASNLKAIKEIIGEDDYGRLFEVGNHSMLANTILDVIKDKDEERLEKNFVYAHDNFDIYIHNKKVFDLYKNSIDI